MGVQQINSQSNENIIVMQFIFVEEPKFLIHRISLLLFYQYPRTPTNNLIVAIQDFHSAKVLQRTWLAARKMATRQSQ